MRLSNLLSRSAPPRRRNPRSITQRQRRRAFVESLEDRRLLASFTVITPGDAGVGNCTLAQCTLRDAVTAANNNPGPDEIEFSPAIIGTIGLNTAALEISEAVSITGPGRDLLTIEANAVASEFRVIDVTASTGDVTIEGLTLTGGRVPNEAGGAIQFQSSGTLSIQSSTISGNMASNGGGIYSLDVGKVEITDSTISGNTAMFGAGGGIQNVDGDISVTSSVIDSNTALSDGGGLFTQFDGNLTVTNSEVTNNRVTYSGYYGGGINSNGGDVTISGSTISGNVANGDGGGLYNFAGTVTITDSTMSDNEATDGAGGAILNDTGNLSLTGTTVDNNRALNGDGGGISNGSGTLTLTRSTISGNRSVTDGGGIATNNGPVVAIESTISGNTSTLSGGGIASITGVIALTNVTVSGNVSNQDGGGVQSDSAPVHVVNSTITLNQTSDDGGGIGFAATNDGETLTLVNSIVADNVATNNPDFTAPGNPTTNRQVDNSLIGDNEGTGLGPSPLSGGIPQPDARGNLVGGGANPIIDPLLGPLAFNGGSTRTHDLLAGSLAIDAGDNTLAIHPGPDGQPGGGDDTPIANDQRSFPFERIIDGGSGTATVDMGALETQPQPTFLVDTNTDVVDGDLSPGNRSLREVIQLTNASLGADVIRFSASVTGNIALDPVLGALTITDAVTIEGPGADQLTIAPVIPNPSQFRIFDITAAAGDVSISDLTLTRGNPADNGGAIRFASAGSLTVSRSTLRANRATLGAAVYSDSGTVTIIASTLDGNDASLHGGGVAAISGSIDVIASTISDNTANGLGGGVYSVNAAVGIFNSTITLNNAGLEGGGVGLADDNTGETLTVQNSIIAANTGTSNPDFNAPGDPANNLNVDFSVIGSNAGTTLTPANSPDSDGNLIGGDGGSVALIDPLLGSLADNGGPTRTHALLAGSPAIDVGGSQILPPDTFDIDNDGDTNEILPTDQRGAVRVVGAGLDIGAFEIPPLATVTWDPPEDITFGTPLSGTELDATANTPGTFVYTPPAGTELNVGDGQTLSTEFTPDNLLAFRPVTAQTQINVLKADPVIVWSNPGDIDFGTALSSTQLNATVVGIPGSFAYSPDFDAVLDGGTGQTLMTTFTPDDLANYNEVTATVTINVNPVDPVIDWATPDPIVFGTALSNAQLNATVQGNIAGTFVYDPDIATVLNAGDTQPLMVTFTPDAIQNYNEVTKTVMIDVAKADPVINWSNPADIDAGTPLDGTQLNASVTGIPGVFVYDPQSGTVLPAGNGQDLNVTFTPTDQDNYNIAMATVQINVIAVVALDFGDAPSNYPVLLADDGARHVTGTLRLGSAVDAEADGQPSAAADGDGTDDDGVAFIADAVADPSVDTVSSFLVTASETGVLDAWIDFNGNGDWGDAREQIASGVVLFAGTNTLSYTIPGGASVGDTVARFRISSAGNLTPTGEAADGEVEDHIVTILDGSASPDVAVIAPLDNAIIRADQGNVFVSDSQADLFGVPLSDLGSLDVQTTSSDDSITVDFLGGNVIPAGGLRLDGTVGENTLVLVGQNPEFNFTSSGNVEADNFGRIDLTDDSANVITIDTFAVTDLSPSDSTVLVVGGDDDAIIFDDADDWRLTEPLIVGGRFLRVATNMVTGSVVQIDLPNPWQNPIDPSDVNNDGGPTANDALNVINELSRRSFSDSDTQFLDDALTTSPWPGFYYDQNGDGKATALDALRVINRLAQIANSGEGESLPSQIASSDLVEATRETTSPQARAAAIDQLHTNDSTSRRTTSATIATAVAATAKPESSDSAIRSTASTQSVDQLLSDSSFLDHVLR